MTVLLARPYGQYAAASVVTLPKSTEDALIAQGLATTALSTATTPGAVSSGEFNGRVAIAAGASSVVVTSPWVTVNSKLCAYVSQATADVSLLRVERIVCAAGSFTIFGTANATATTLIDWALLSMSEIPIV